MALRRVSFASLIACGVAVLPLLVACSSTSRLDSGFGDLPDAGGKKDGSASSEPTLVENEGDGSAAQGKCSPSAANAEIPGNNCDDDGDGTVDNANGCDTGLPVSGDAAAFAKALGLCRAATGDGWGIVSATYSNGYGRTTPPNDAQHGIHPSFGTVIKPREGSALGVLSTGYAREHDARQGARTFKKEGLEAAMQNDGSMPTEGLVPRGYPKPAAGCQVDTSVYDTIVVNLKVKVPMNAKGLSFDFNFWSGEWPEYVCTQFNDGFIAYLKSEAFNGGAPENISFDAQNNPVSVNNGFFDRCTPNTQTGCAPGAGGVRKTAACAGGTAELAGTGFGTPEGTFCSKRSSPGGATGWLTSTAPVKPGETIDLQFIIWDTGDANFNSSVLLDNFKWVPGETTTVTERPK